MMRSQVLLLLSSLLVLPALAQDEESLDEVMVTGSRISYADLDELPAATVTKPGDYLALSVTLVNDTRDPDKRQRELHDSIRSMLRQAGAIEVRGPDKDEGDLPLAEQRLDLQFDEDPSRADVSTITLKLRVKVIPAPTAVRSLALCANWLPISSGSVGPKSPTPAASRSAFSSPNASVAKSSGRLPPIWN